METGRNCSMLGINSEHHNLPTYEISFEIEQCWICVVLWWPFWKWWPVEIFRCQESIRDIIIYLQMKCHCIGQCWICAVLWQPFWKWQPVEIFQCRESISTHISNFDDIGQCWIFAVLWRPFWKWWPVEICQCWESIRDIIIYPHNFLMSGINSEHQHLPTYEISLKSNNVEFVRYCDKLFWKWQTSWKFGRRRIAPLMVT